MRYNTELVVISNHGPDKSVPAYELLPGVFIHESMAGKSRPCFYISNREGYSIGEVNAATLKGAVEKSLDVLVNQHPPLDFKILATKAEWERTPEPERRRMISAFSDLKDYTEWLRDRVKHESH